MRRIAVSVSLILVAAACGGPASQVSRSGPVVPLEATLLPPTHGIGFYVNQPAHIAIFDIVPGAGIGLVYPQMGRELKYPVRSGPRWIGRGVPYWPASYRPPANSPMHYLFLVASREELRIDDYVGYSDYLRDKFTNVVYTGNAYTAMEAVTTEVVPPQPDADWATALYIVYGGARGDRRRPVIYQLVKCLDGSVYWVQLGSSFVCGAPPAKADTLKEGDSKPPEGKRKWKHDVLLFDPANLPAADALLRRPVAKIDRPPLAPDPARSSFSDMQRAGNRDRERAPSLPDGNTGSGVYVPVAPTITTPAQQPSNPRGRVEDPGAGSSTGGAGTP